MIKKTTLLMALSFLMLHVQAQTLLFDFEAPETSTNFQIFGGNLEGVITANIANPDASGINTSATVAEGKKASDAPDWGGMFTNPNSTETIDATSGGQICFDIWSSEAVPVLLKLENDDVSNVWETSLSTAGASAWETLCYDLATIGNGGAAASGTFTRIVLFYDFGTVGTGTERVFYLDNFTAPTATTTSIECIDLYNFEPTTMDSFSTFGATDTTLVPSEFIIPNPAGDAVNGSTSVLRYTKQADAQVWAGMFFDMANTIDANFAYQVCVDYWSPNGGDLLLKLENGSNPTWETLQTSSTAGGWETLCYDLSADDIGGSATGPATGRIFSRMVLFADFGTMGAATDTEYYFDNFLVKVDNSVSAYDVTFSVDMNGVTGFTQPYVSGTFNNWSGTANPLDDADGDGVWSATLNIDQGTHEYKFNFDDWAGQEQFDLGYSCTVTNDTGEFTNRVTVITDNTDLGTVCYNSCYACGDAVSITINMGQGNEMVSPEGFYIAGGGNFGNPGDFPLTDDDGDGAHSITIERQVGFTSFYTFTNGACGDYSCKENIAGQDCANPDDFNDRDMGPVMQDTVINTCFGFCSDNLECGDAALRSITFEVNTNPIAGTFTQPYLSGNFNSWSGDANPMDDADGDGIYSLTLDLLPGNYEYKFTFDNWALQEEFVGGEDCTITDASGDFVNRELVVGEDDMMFCFTFNTCSDCTSSTSDLDYDGAIFEVNPSVIVNGQTQIIFGDNYTDQKELTIVNAVGQRIQSILLNGNTDRYTLNVNELKGGFYFINVQTQGKQMTSKIVITY